MPLQPEILIVDDSNSNRVSLAASILGLDVDIHIASSGAEAVSMAREHRPSVILLDSDMPDMDGYQVINQLVIDSRTNSIPVLLLETSFERKKRALHDEKIRPADIIYKPINPSQLRKKLELFLSAHRFRQEVTRITEFEKEMGDQVDEGMLGIDSKGTILYASSAMLRLLRTTLSELLGVGLETLLEKNHHSTEPSWPSHMVATTTAEGKTVQVKKAVLWSAEGTRITTTFIAVPTPDSEEMSALLVFKDISNKSSSDEKIAQLSNHDPLTGLSNRFKFEEVLTGLIELYKAKTNVLISKKRSAPCAVLFVGLDHFSYINDGLGHDTGDKLLKAVAHRLQRCVSDLDLVARLGGDEFTVALTHMFTAKDATETAQRIHKSLDEPFLIDGHEIFTSASIGIATYPECGNDSRTLLTNGDRALQNAKRNGRHRIEFFTAEMNRYYLEKIELECKLRQALSEEHLSLHFKPIIEMASREIVGHEAILRWCHPEEGEMDGSSLLKEIEQPHIITQINRWMFHHACYEYAQWMQADPSRHHMSLTISLPAFHLLNKGLVDLLTDSIADSELNPANLNLRITECDQDIHLADFSKVVNKISNLDIKLSLSMFTSTRAPISNMLALDLDSIRIERSFIADVLDDPRSAIFIKGLISMAHNLGMQVTADGVDSDKHESFLHSVKCDHVLGNIYAPAAPLA